MAVSPYSSISPEEQRKRAQYQAYQPNPTLGAFGSGPGTSPAPDSFAANAMAFKFPGNAVQGYFQNLGHTSRRSNPFVSFAIETLAPNNDPTLLNILYQLRGGNAADPSGFNTFAQNYIQSLFGNSANRGANGFFNYEDMRNAIRSLFGGTGPAGIREMINGSGQNVGQSIDYVRALIDAMGATALTPLALQQVQAGLQNKIDDFLTSFTQGVTNNNGFADYLLRSGFIDEFF
ncbi:hypothetical protein [Nitrolancea hollandica]|uniref:Uncharacterized protein n=1 Tax=Nitrolancea hollandica Lb TaxID=1129897 RepID=I4EL54_9BACT|nr:hypothetical protein [Nitrolancea hollandica]CCF85416.1 hypothetical protein NITHO_4940003 [Nitrolancea hollandica Lb]